MLANGMELWRGAHGTRLSVSTDPAPVHLPAALQLQLGLKSCETTAQSWASSAGVAFEPQPLVQTTAAKAVEPQCWVLCGRRSLQRRFPPLELLDLGDHISPSPSGFQLRIYSRSLLLICMVLESLVWSLPAN